MKLIKVVALVGLMMMVPMTMAADPPVAKVLGEKGTVELGAYYGYPNLDNYGSIEPENDGFWGVRGGYWFSRTFSLEASYQTQSSASKTTGTEADLDSFRLNALFNFGSGNVFRPFLTFGVGSEGVDFESLKQQNVGWNVGGGLRWFLPKHFGVRIDGRYVYTPNGGVGIETTTTCSTRESRSCTVDERLVNGGSQGDTEGSVGVFFAF